MAISIFNMPPDLGVGEVEKVYQNPINELLSTNDIAYSNIFYVDFSFSEADKKEKKDADGNVIEVDGVVQTEDDIRNLDNRIRAVNPKPLFEEFRAPIESSLPTDFKMFKSIKENIFTRLESFSIPQQMNDTHTMSYFNRDFLRVSTTYKQNKILNLTFTLDDYMALLYRLGKLSKYTDLSLNDINNSHGQAAFNNHSFCLDIILHVGMLDGNNFNSESTVQYVFKNAKMLGFDSGLKFTRDTTQKMTVAVSFRYQEMVKTYPTPLIAPDSTEE